METSYEALVQLNQHAKLLAETFVKVDQQVAMMIVKEVHRGRFEQAQLNCYKRMGVEFSVAMLSELAQFYRLVWGLDASRDARTRCSLCVRELPQSMEDFCTCFRATEVGVWIEDVSRDAIAFYRKQQPRTWESMVVETFACTRCPNIQKVVLGEIAPRVERGAEWVHGSRKFCQNCFQQDRAVKHSTRPPAPLRNRNPISNPTVKHTDIEKLQQMVAHALPPAGES